VISNYVPPAYEYAPTVMESAFFELLHFTVVIYRGCLPVYKYVEECRICDGSNGERRLLSYFDKAMPWMDVFFDRGGGVIKHFLSSCPRVSLEITGNPASTKERMQVRRPLPASWAGLMDKELERVSGIRGAIFCHKGGLFRFGKQKKQLCRLCRKL